MPESGIVEYGTNTSARSVGNRISGGSTPSTSYGESPSVSDVPTTAGDAPNSFTQNSCERSTTRSRPPRTISVLQRLPAVQYRCAERG